MNFFLLILFTFHFAFCNAQNLVPNCSFEDTAGCCPQGLGNMQYVKGWVSCGTSISSPDYFNTYDTAYPNVPYNTVGYQWPATGNAYMGIAIYVKGLPNQKEFIGRNLTASLTIGQKYYISIKTSFTTDQYEMGYAANKLGVLFSTVAYSNANPVPVNNFAHIYTDSINTDSVNWTTVSSWFTADSTYSYINIGNFFNDVNTDTVTFNDSLWGGYYYIDDVCVSVDSTKCSCVVGISVENQVSKNDIKVFNDAYNAYVIINTNDIKNISLSLYDMFGREVKKTENISEKIIRIDKDGLTNGIYILKIHYSNKIFVQKVILTN